MSQDPQRSVLHARHVELGAKFAEFGGWLMPLEYSGGGVLAEHAAVRTGVGIFDVSHLGTLIVRGPGTVDALNRVLTNDLRRIGPGRAQYSMLCDDDGGVVDDLICYIRSDDDVLVIPNASNAATVADVLDAAVGEAISVSNVHRDYAIIAVQGPASDEVVSAVGLPVGMDYMAFESVRHDGVELSVCRTGYTGERGYEVVVPARGAVAIWDAQLAAGAPQGILPCGLGARDTLRTEMGYSLHGHEINPDINPVEAGLTWAIGWSKGTFHGSEALRRIRAEGPSRRARGLLALGRGIPRPGMTVVDAEGNALGTVTSGTFSPTLRSGIALALLRPDVELDSEVGVLVRHRVEPFRVVTPPFVTPGVREG